MDKVYDQTEIEQKWYKFWEDEGFFKADPDSPKTAYSLLIPPPNLTGELHLGHAMEHSILDAIARFKRMQGFDVLLLPGVDHAGIQFEAAFDKKLSKQGLSKQKLGRSEWLKKAWQFKEEIYKTVSSTWRFMGLSADWSREVFSLEPKIQQAVLEEFKTFWEQDLLYKGAYIVQWCPKCGTAIEDVEMEYEERKEKLYYVRYKVMGIGEYITVATARPETIAADVAIAIYPNHPEYSKFLDKKAVNPITHTEILIIQDERVDKTFGTGALKITPGHDTLDYEIGKDNNLHILHVIGKDGRVVKETQIIGGLRIDEARTKIVQYLAEKGHIRIEDVKDYTHSVPVCERCKTTVEPLISEEWFVKMAPLAQKTLKRIKEVNFIPKNYLKILSDWIKNLHDWSISRSLWWGHQIPVWYCQKCTPDQTVDKSEGMVISLEKPKQSCPKCSANQWIQDEKVLDTWFSSGLWPLSTLGWPQKTKELEKYFPWDSETSAPEIKFLWIARMIMLSFWFTDKIPFKNQFFHGMLRDLAGRKFSKSLGNGIDPNELRAQWGTDAVRMALYGYSIPGRDGRASKQTMDERCKNYRNFSTKLWNIGKFITTLKPDKTNTKLEFTHPDDKKIKEDLGKTIHSVTKHLDSFQLHLATEALYEFIWHEFADLYIEKSKDRRAEAQPVLEYVFRTSLELLHPFMPFITEELWQHLSHIGNSIMLSPWPISKK